MSGTCSVERKAECFFSDHGLTHDRCCIRYTLIHPDSTKGPGSSIRLDSSSRRPLRYIRRLKKVAWYLNLCVTTVTKSRGTCETGEKQAVLVPDDALGGALSKAAAEEDPGADE